MTLQVVGWSRGVFMEDNEARWSGSNQERETTERLEQETFDVTMDSNRGLEEWGIGWYHIKGKLKEYRNRRYIIADNMKQYMLVTPPELWEHPSPHTCSWDPGLVLEVAMGLSCWNWLDIYLLQLAENVLVPVLLSYSWYSPPPPPPPRKGGARGSCSPLCTGGSQRCRRGTRGKLESQQEAVERVHRKQEVKPLLPQCLSTTTDKTSYHASWQSKTDLKARVHFHRGAGGNPSVTSRENQGTERSQKLGWSGRS